MTNHRGPGPVPFRLAAGANITLTPSPIVGSGTIASSGGGGGGTVTVTPLAVLGNLGTVTSSGASLALGAGILRQTGTNIAIWNEGTISGFGAGVTITPGNSLSAAILSQPAANVTVDLAAGVSGQKFQLNVITPGSVATIGFGSSVIFGLDIPAYIPTATAGKTDELLFICTPLGDWRLSSVNHGFAH